MYFQWKWQWEWIFQMIPAVGLFIFQCIIPQLVWYQLWNFSMDLFDGILIILCTSLSCRYVWMIKRVWFKGGSETTEGCQITCWAWKVSFFILWQLLLEFWNSEYSCFNSYFENGSWYFVCTCKTSNPQFLPCIYKCGH